MLLKPVLTLLLAALISNSFAQPSSGTIFENLKKLNVLGSVLYIAAHPDDENTLMLSYLSKDRLVQTSYLALTRGDGGQNLIGAEQGYNIGLIRTQELLAARRTDGADQYFSRAYDFGYSKTREETLKFWDEEKVLGDVVWMIRKVQPDVIITRFPPDARAGHGHHQTSAYLAEKAFSLSADPKSYPDQLKYYDVWQAKRLVWNSYTPGFTNNAPNEEKSSYIGIEIGGYNPVLGESYTEIAANSRSMHKSQGFGSSPSRGSRIDYFLHTLGEPAKLNLFDGVDITWKRIKGSETVQKLISEAITDFAISDPEKTVPALLNIANELNNLNPDNFYVKVKKEEVKSLLMQCLGLWFETNPEDYSGIPGSATHLKISIVKRSAYPVKLVALNWTGSKSDSMLNINLENNKLINIPVTVLLSIQTKISQPYWLEKPVNKGIFQIDDQTKIGLPENQPTTTTTFKFEINGQHFTYTTPWLYKFNDPAKGEIYRPFEIRPKVTVTINEPVFIFTSTAPRPVQVTVQAQNDSITGSVSLNLPKEWKSVPESFNFDLPRKYQETYITFNVTPSAEEQEIMVTATANVDRQTYDKGIKTISYDHIPAQTLFPPASSKLAKIDIKSTAKSIGYIPGAGDDIPSALKQMGCAVDILDETSVTKNLTVYDAIILGIRAYNTNEWLNNFQPKLMDYVKNGGTMVVQYTIPNDQKVKQIGPYPFQTNHDRITEEDAPLKMLSPGHRIFNYPNKITKKDFDGWVQERGLYFAQSSDTAHYQALLSGHDTGEPPLEGSLLYTNYGKGHYIYTGLSFFRELPAGVTGAYRLFANLISVGK